MLAEAITHFSKPAEVNDASDLGALCGFDESGREHPVPLGILIPGYLHGMDEVVRCVAALEMLMEIVVLREIALGDRDPIIVHPRTQIEFSWFTNDASDTISGLQKGLDETPAYIPCSAGDRDEWGGGLIGFLCDRCLRVSEFDHAGERMQDQ